MAIAEFATQICLWNSQYIEKARSKEQDIFMDDDMGPSTIIIYIYMKP